MVHADGPDRAIVDDETESGDHCTMSVRVRREVARRFASLARTNDLSRSMLIRLMIADALQNGLTPAVREATDALRLAKASI